LVQLGRAWQRGACCSNSSATEHHPAVAGALAPLVALLRCLREQDIRKVTIRNYCPISGGGVQRSDACWSLIAPRRTLPGDSRALLAKLMQSRTRICRNLPQKIKNQKDGTSRHARSGAHVGRAVGAMPIIAALCRRKPRCAQFPNAHLID